MKVNRELVPRPKNTVVTHHSNGTDYVFLTVGFKYRKNIKRTEPLRLSIGKLDENGMLIPNKNYFMHFNEKDE